MKRLFQCFLILSAFIFLAASLSIGDARSRSGDDAGPEAKEQLAGLETFLKKDPSNYQNLKTAGILASGLARNNPKTYARRAVDYLTRAHDLDKLDDETLCYLGSAVTLMAKTTINPFKKSGYVNRGCGYMDKAVRRSPDNITVRMTRGYNSMALPGFLKRRSLAFEDFEYLAQRFEKEPDLPASLKRQVYENLAELYRRTKETGKAEQYDRLASVQQDPSISNRKEFRHVRGSND